jgi:hypothetical protein
MRSFVPMLVLVPAALLIGCGKKETAQSQPDVPPPATTAEAAQPAPAAAVPQIAPSSAPINMLAIEKDIKDGAVDRAAAALLAARQTPRPMTVDESLKVNDQMRQLQLRVAQMIASGDPRAKQAAEMLKRYQPR